MKLRIFLALPNFFFEALNLARCHPHNILHNTLIEIYLYVLDNDEIKFTSAVVFFFMYLCV